MDSTATNTPQRNIPFGKQSNMFRRRQEEEKCTAVEFLQTAYNDNALVPAYPGIMFQVVSLAEDIEILTLQFDARLNDITDYSVEVFITDSDYESKLNDESQWKRLANTEASIAPSGRGLMIPQSEFKSVKLKRGQRRTIYIAMKGPWLDITAQALDKTGEVQVQENDLALYVGVGLNERFPSDFDKTVDPQFAGVIHYRRPVECTVALDATTIDLGFMASLSEDPIFVARLNKKLDEIVKDTMLKTPPFSTLAKQYELKQAQPTEISKHSFQEDICPDEWEACPRNLLAPRMYFEHTDGLQPGFLKYEIYRFTQALTDLLRMRLNTQEIIYTGMLPVVSEYYLTVGGIPMEETFTEKKRTFLESASTDYFSATVSERDNLVQVLDTKIDIHETIKDNGRRRLRGLATRGSLQVAGSVMGVQPSYLPMTNFPIVLRESVKGREDDFMESIKMSAAMWPDVGDSSTSIEYFGRIDSLSASFDAEIVEYGEFEEPSAKEGPDTTVLITLGIVAVVLLVIVKLIWECFQSCRNSRLRVKREKMIQQKKIEKELREILRQEQKQERQKIPTEVSVPSDDEGTPTREKQRGVRRAHSSDGLPGRSDSPRRGSRRRAHSSADLEHMVFGSLRRSGRSGEVEGLLASDDQDLSPPPPPPTGATGTPQSPRRKTKRSPSLKEAKNSPTSPTRKSKRAVSCNEATISRERSQRSKAQRSKSCNEATVSGVDSPIRPPRRSVSMDGSGPPRSPKRRGGRRSSSSENDTKPKSPRRTPSGTKSALSSSRSNSTSRINSTSRSNRASRVGSGVDRSPRNVERRRSDDLARSTSTASEKSSDFFIPNIRTNASRSSRAVDPPAAVPERRPSVFFTKSESSTHSRRLSMFSRSEESSSHSRRPSLFSRSEEASSHSRRPSFFAQLYQSSSHSRNEDSSAHGRRPSLFSSRAESSNHSRSSHSRSNHNLSNHSHSNQNLSNHSRSTHNLSNHSRSNHSRSNHSRASLRETAIDRSRPMSPRRSSAMGYFQRSPDSDDDSTSDNSFYDEPSRRR